MSNNNVLAAALLALSCGALAACSGGGGGGTPPTPSSTTPGVSPTVAPTPTPSPSPTPLASSTLSGTVVDLPYDGTSADPGYSVLANGAAAAPGSPISGAQIYVGPSVLSGSAAPSTVPAGFLHATSGTAGTFTIANVPIGHLAITIFAPAPHVTIVHRDLITSAPKTTGTYFMTVPSVDESAWFAQENVDRADFSAPPTVLDESVVEAARYWAQFMQANNYFAHCIPASLCVSGDTTPPPASYAPQDVDPQHRFAYFHGYSGGREGENIAGGFTSWQSVDATFMAEQTQCPNSSPVDCPFGGTTGHFLNIVDASYVWTGFGIAELPGDGPFYDQEFTLLESTTPSASIRHGMPLAR